MSSLKEIEARGLGSPQEGKHHYQPHLAIAIFGPSGSGKSSLLRTLADDVGRSKDCQLLPKELSGDVATLPVMNPTTWAASDQFLYAFLAAALEEESKKQAKEDYGYPQGLSPVQLAFQEVNEYLRVVDEPEGSGEHDPLGLSLQKLERHTSGLRLREALGSFVEELARQLRSQVVLLPVDDLDMSPSHLVESLQTYQSFLNHPRLVPIFTFTDRTAEELIEVYYRRQLEERESQLHPSAQRLTISEQLSIQFLARCFPVRNRIRLGPAPARVQRATLLYKPKEEDLCQGVDGVERRQVSELLTTASFLLFGHPDREDSHSVKAALRPSTLRRQFQVVDAMADCRLEGLRSPQFVRMEPLNPSARARDIEKIFRSGERAPSPVFRKKPSSSEGEDDLSWKGWKDWSGATASRARETLPWIRADLSFEAPPPKDDTTENKLELVSEGYRFLERQLARFLPEGTWATIFNGATWSLLNVHRDTLRELGLFLENLYSWSPKELRSVVVDNILAQDQATRRTVLDRWSNRADYRRNQVLSLLAANIFRPWIVGEEPHGDEEVPLRAQQKLEKEGSGTEPVPANSSSSESDETKLEIDGPLSFSSSKGFLWFLNVTMGFYLPQIMARGWSDALSPEISIKGRMSGYGWSLQQAPVNAIRAADTKQEIFSFGMLFLDPTEYRLALEGALPRDKVVDSADEETRRRGRLLLRLWGCAGYSHGRYWAAFSLWRGLSFIGQMLEWSLENLPAGASDDPSMAPGTGKYSKHLLDIQGLIRAHCLASLVPGELLNHNASDRELLQGFPRWNVTDQEVVRETEQLASDILKWLLYCQKDQIFPLPAGGTWVGWADCFIRRIHGEYILGGLWPRLNAAYLEDQSGEGSQNLEKHCPPGENGSPPRCPEEEKYRWTAAVAAGTWSDLLLEYWRGCPAILRLLLTCPVFFKSRERFGLLTTDRKDGGDQGGSGPSEARTEAFLRLLGKEAPGQGSQSPPADSPPDSPPGSPPDSKARDSDLHFAWLNRLDLPPEAWAEIFGYWSASGSAPSPGDWQEVVETLEDIPAAVPDVLGIKRISPDQFLAPRYKHLSIKQEPETGAEPSCRESPPSGRSDRGGALGRQK